MVPMVVVGYEPTVGRCFSCSEASVRAVSLSPCSSRYNCKAFSNIKIVPPKFTFRGMSLVCKAGSNGFAGNLGFSRQNKHGFSQNKNKQNDRESSDSLQEFLFEIGLLKSSPSAPKFQPNGTPPEPRKKEDNVFSKLKKHITRLGNKSSRNDSSSDDKNETLAGSFGKEKSTSSPQLARNITPMGRKSSSSNGSNRNFLDQFKEVSDEEKSVSSPKLPGEIITRTERKSISNGSGRDFLLDQSEQDCLINEEKSMSSFDSSNLGEQESSFLNLLNRHDAQMGKNSGGNGSSKDSTLDHSAQNGSVNKEKSTASFDSNDFVQRESPTLSRPVSNFRRRSPIPRVKFELIRSNTDLNLDGQRESTLLEHEKREDSSDFVVGYGRNEAEQKSTAEDDLSAMKLPELKALAKSRGMKGLSRLRKHQLLELLSGDST